MSLNGGALPVQSPLRVNADGGLCDQPDVRFVQSSKGLDRVKQRPFLMLAVAVLTVVCLIHFTGSAYGQTAMPSADQIEAFRNLPQDEQQQLMQQFGLGGGGLGNSSGLGTGTSIPAGGLQGQFNRQQALGQEASQLQQQQRRELDQEELDRQSPYLKALDWVIIEIDYQLPPRGGNPQQQNNLLLNGLQQQGIQTGQQPGTTNQLTPLLPGQVPNMQGNQLVPGAQLLNQQQQFQQIPQNQQNFTGPAGASMERPDGTGTEPNWEDEKKRLDEMMELIRARNPYRLTREGMLNLPGFPPIALSGLTDEQATLRLRVEPAFRKVDIRLTRLPLRKTGSEALKPFGYDLFNRPASTFAPVTNVPVPSDYVIGPGDELDVQLYGSQNRTLRFIVGRDGRISFPELGPINVGGQLFNSAKVDIESRVARQMIGVKASVSMGDTRSIRVFVVGEANRPGSYTISGLGTITSALFASGGVKPIGSLRKVQLKRQGAVVRTLDLYDLLIRGDTTDDAKLLQGDVIFIPPVGPTVSIDGEVKRPAIYEIKNESSIADVIQLAGGLTPEADGSRAELTRIDDSQHRVVLHVDLAPQSEKAQGVRNGDILRVDRLRPSLDGGVVVQGHVYTSGVFAYHDGLRLSDVIHSVDDLEPNADLHYLLIRRELPPDRHVAILSADLVAALSAPGTAVDVPMMPRDRIMVFDLASGRDHDIQPWLEELRLQSSSTRPTPVVHVDGQVKVPGDYPLESGMTVRDLVRAGGGLADAAYRGRAELTRYTVVDGETRRTELLDVDIADVLKGNPAANIKLEAFDNLSIKEVPEWRGQESVELKGEVRFPGRYAIKRGETLRSVLARAGGLTQYAFPEGSVFTREELRRREQQQMDMLATRMQSDLTVLALQGAVATQLSNQQGGTPAALVVGQSLLSQLRAARAVGRLVIDLPAIVRYNPGSQADVILRNGDTLVVPRVQQEVTVIGEVQTSTSHLYRSDLTRDEYISLSGGMTRRGDAKRIYVVRANGSVVAAESGSRWFSQGGNGVRIKPGDTIVVPLDAEKYPALPFWQAVTQIIYNVAIAAAAVHSF